MRFREFSAARPTIAPEARVSAALPDRPAVPVVVEPLDAGVDLAEWARDASAWVDAHLFRHGAVLFRGFALPDASDFERTVRALASTGELMDYVENTSPRTSVRGNVKTSTDHPAAQPIVLHNEHSFSNVFPSKLFLHCRRAPDGGGETPLADGRRILARLPASIRDRFKATGYLYVRNFGDGFGPDWPSVFGTDDRAALERYLRAHDIAFDWRSGDRLQVRYRRPTEVRHPITGESVWFNHVLFWHVSSLEPPVRDLLTRSFSEAELPNQSFYGDGTSIEPDVIEALRSAYDAEVALTPWRAGDVLVVDNLLLAHGRRPYTGERLVLFAMADPWTRAALS